MSDTLGAGYSTTGGRLGPDNSVFTWSFAPGGLSDFTEFFPSGTIDFAGRLAFDFQAALRRAFDQWSAAANIEFIQVPDSGAEFGGLFQEFPDIRIGFGVLDAGGARGFATFPFTANKGFVWLDSAAGWNAQTLFFVAMHEIGHVLGLDHSPVANAVMNASANSAMTGLQADDIAGIRSIYGAQDEGPNVYILAESQASLTVFDGAPNLVIEANGLDNTVAGSPGGERINGGGGVDTLLGDAGNDTLDGGAGADFLLGGEGDDVYHIDDTFDLVDEGVAFPTYGHGGFDTIVSSANWFWDVYSIAERMVIADNASDPSGAGATIVGSIWNNELVGNSKTNILFGRGGADTYRAGDGIDFISLSTLGLTDQNAYAGVNGANTIIVDARAAGATSYDIIFEFESGKDKIDVASYGYASVNDVLARGVDDGAGNSYFALGDGFDYVYFVGLTKAQIAAGDIII